MLQLDSQGELSCASCAMVDLTRHRVRAEKGLVAKGLLGIGLVVVTTAVKFATDVVDRPRDVLLFAPFIAFGAVLIAVGVAYELYLRRTGDTRSIVGQLLDRLTAKVFRQRSR